jgi:hypothetical protein
MASDSGHMAAARLDLVNRALERLRANPPEGTAAIWSRAAARPEPGGGMIRVEYVTADGASAAIATTDLAWQGVTFPPYGAMFVEALWRVLDGGRPLVPDSRWPEDLSPLRGLVDAGDAPAAPPRQAGPPRGAIRAGRSRR